MQLINASRGQHEPLLGGECNAFGLFQGLPFKKLPHNIVLISFLIEYSIYCICLPGQSCGVMIIASLRGNSISGSVTMQTSVMLEIATTEAPTWDRAQPGPLCCQAVSFINPDCSLFGRTLSDNDEAVAWCIGQVPSESFSVVA